MNTDPYGENRPIYRITAGTKTAFEVHSDRCHHGRRRMLQTFLRIRAATPARAIKCFADDDVKELGYTEDDFRIMDCSKSK